MMFQLAPSILSSDHANLEEAVRIAEEGGADLIHIDVMDGHFVPNITIGPPVVRCLREATSLPLDVHLMISNPVKHIPAFAEAGADILTVHVEATPHLHRALQVICDLGVRPGVTLNPATPAAALSEVVCDVDLVLVMSVNPGFGGQVFVERSLQKISAIRDMLDEAGSEADLEVDGGINVETAKQVAAAGASVLVAGTSIFQASEGVRSALLSIREAAQGGL